VTLTELSPLAWVLLATGAMVVGFAKTAVGGAGALAVVAFAAVLPARESTGALLPLLCVGDLVAVRVYHRHANWRLLARMLPGVLPGLLLGAWFVSSVDDTLMRRSIGAILLVMCAVQVWMRRSAPILRDEGGNGRSHPHHLVTLGMGAAAGFATMTANAAGPVTTLYLLVAGLPMLEFLGTAAWFYLVVNAAKLPISAGLSLMSMEGLVIDALLVLPLLAGAAAGVFLMRRIDQSQFDRAALALTAVAAVGLLV
jgi:uncharacterized membrane protein YfcA